MSLFSPYVSCVYDDFPGIEQTIKLHKDTLLPKTAVVLKVLYDEDIVDEDQLLEWAKKVGYDYYCLLCN